MGRKFTEKEGRRALQGKGPLVIHRAVRPDPDRDVGPGPRDAPPRTHLPPPSRARPEPCWNTREQETHPAAWRAAHAKPCRMLAADFGFFWILPPLVGAGDRVWREISEDGGWPSGPRRQRSRLDNRGANVHTVIQQTLNVDPTVPNLSLKTCGGTSLSGLRWEQAG